MPALPMKLARRWITGAALLSTVAISIFLLIGCSSAPTSRSQAGIGAPMDDSLDVEKVAATTGQQKIALTVHPPAGQYSSPRGALDKHRVFITFQPEDPRDTVTVEVTSQPGDKKKKLAVVLSTPPPVTSTTGPHPIAMTIEPGKKR